MKKFIRFYILTVRRDLGLLALISAGFIFLMDLLLKKIPAPNEFFYVCGNFFYGLSAAYIASFVFYFVDIHYKRQREKELLYGYIGHLFKIIINDGKDIYKDMFNSIDTPFDLTSATKDDVLNVCTQINPLSNSTIKCWHGDSYLNWIEYLEYKKRRMLEFMSKIQAQIQFADIEFVEIITRYADCEIFSGLDIMLRLSKEKRWGNQNFLNGLETGFISYLELLKTSELYYQKEFADYDIKQS